MDKVLTAVGITAKQIFDRAQLPNDVLVRIWNLADTEQRGQLSCTEFIIAMHLLASYRIGALRALPNNLPAGLYEAAARRGAPPSRPVSGSRSSPEMHAASAVPRSFSGTAAAPRTSSPLARQQYPAPAMSTQSTGAMDNWLINPQEKAQFDSQFARLDTANSGQISGDQAVDYFSKSRLPEDDLATIWDLSDITSTGQLNRDEFAVAMYLIRQQLTKRGPLPTSLPPALVPPSLRRQTPAPPAPPARQQTAPVNPPKPKSAAEDLFGLDALSAPEPQAPQSTGGSSAFTPSPSEHASSQPQSMQSSTMFKPFVPTSTFGQSIVTPHATGSPGDARAPQQTTTTPRANDDLLGDADPEVSKRLTSETSELANLSNQVGNLSNQMKEVQTKRGSTGQNLSQVNAQKKDFETRLTQLRSAYEQEAREVKSLEDRLAQARNETQKMQQDLAMVQHSYESLQEQKQQMQASLEAEQKENANLKERMRAVNNESTQLKAQVEKMRSDARQQKGLVAINKKQLSTNEAERDKAKTELEQATTEYNDATRELENSKQALAGPPPSTSNAPAVTSSVVASPAAASPAPSAASMNPFFRRTSTAHSERGIPQSSAAATTPNYNAFDSIFGAPSAGAARSTPPPPTSFQREARSESGASSAENAAEPTGSSTPSNRPSTSQSDFPSESKLPPPPPQSRQITSSLLPFQEHGPRAASPSSSVGVAPPASRFGDVSDLGTEPDSDRPGTGHDQSPLSQMANASTAGDTKRDSEEIPTPHAGSFNFPSANAPSSSAPMSAPLSAAQHIPGAFPKDLTPMATPYMENNQESNMKSPNENDPFAVGEQEKTQPAPGDAFSSAFADFGDRRQPSDRSVSTEAHKPAARDEFPPIQEFGGDDDSDSDGGKGFDDDFTAASPPRPQRQASERLSGEQPPSTGKPPFPRALTSDTDFSGTQTSSASRQNTVDSAAGPTTGDSNEIAADYADLLPSRELPNSKSNVTQAASNGSAGAAFPDDTDRTARSETVSSHSANPTTKSGFDEFDDEFADLTDAQAADDRGEDSADFGDSRKDDIDEFNPTFDSPAPSKATTFTDSMSHAFHDFESSVSNPPAGGSGSSPAAAKAPAQQPSGDWDAMFAGLDGPSGSDAPAAATNGHSGDAFGSAFAPTPAKAAQTASSSLQPPKPPLARTISTGTEHDDPILKRLTSMGYPREQSLQALEKFDYNLDKVDRLDGINGKVGR